MNSEHPGGFARREPSNFVRHRCLSHQPCACHHAHGVRSLYIRRASLVTSCESAACESDGLREEAGMPGSLDSVPRKRSPMPCHHGLEPEMTWILPGAGAAALLPIGRPPSCRICSAAMAAAGPNTKRQLGSASLGMSPHRAQRRTAENFTPSRSAISVAVTKHG